MKSAVGSRDERSSPRMQGEGQGQGARLTRRSALRLLGAGIGAAAFAACAPAAQTPAPGSATPAGAPIRGGHLIIAVRREAGELDIQKPTIGTTRQYARALHNTLTNVDLKGNVVPELAESWNAPDPKTWEFRLRKGVKFHDGSDFDAAAVKFNMDRILDPNEKSFWRTELFPNVTSVDVVDSHTVRFKLASPDVTIPARMSGRAGHILGPAAARKWGADYATHPVGTGPFELVEWVKDDHLTLKRFAGYWEKDAQGGALPYLDQLTFKPIPDATVMFTALRAGQLQLIEAILPADISKVKAEPNLVAVEGPGTNQVLWFNVSKPPFDNKSLRQAVAWAIDREAIHKAIYFSTGTVGSYFHPPSSWAYNPDAKGYTRDLAKAKAALTAGGQPNGFKFTGLVNNLTVDLQFAQAVKGQLTEVGVDMSIVPLAATANADRRLSGDFEGSFSSLPPTVDPDSDVYANMRTGAGVNRSRYSNAKVDALLDKARSTTAQAERQAAYREVQTLILDDSPIVFLHLDADIKVMHSSVQGYAPTIDSFIGGLGRLSLKA